VSLGFALSVEGFAVASAGGVTPVGHEFTVAFLHAVSFRIVVVPGWMVRGWVARAGGADADGVLRWQSGGHSRLRVLFAGLWTPCWTPFAGKGAETLVILRGCNYR